MECPIKLEVNIAKLYMEGCGGIVETRLTNDSGNVLRNILANVCFKHVTDYGKHAIPTLEPGQPSDALRTQMELPEGCRGEYLIRFEVAVGQADASRLCVGDEKIVVQPWAKNPRRVVEIKGEKAAMGAYVNVNLREAVEAGKVPGVFDLLRKASNQPPNWKEVKMHLEEGRGGEGVGKDDAEQARRAQELLRLLVRKVEEGNPTVISYTQGYEHLFGPIHKGQWQKDVADLLRVATACSPIELPGLGEVRLDTFVVNKRTRWPGKGHFPCVDYDREAWGRVFGGRFLQQDEFPQS